MYIGVLSKIRFNKIRLEPITYIIPLGKDRKENGIFVQRKNLTKIASFARASSKWAGRFFVVRRSMVRFIFSMTVSVLAMFWISSNVTSAASFRAQEWNPETRMASSSPRIRLDIQILLVSLSNLKTKISDPVHSMRLHPLTSRFNLRT